MHQASLINGETEDALKGMAIGAESAPFHHVLTRTHVLYRQGKLLRERCLIAQVYVHTVRVSMGDGNTCEETTLLHIILCFVEVSA